MVNPGGLARVVGTKACFRFSFCMWDTLVVPHLFARFSKEVSQFRVSVYKFLFLLGCEGPQCGLHNIPLGSYQNKKCKRITNLEKYVVWMSQEYTE